MTLQPHLSETETSLEQPHTQIIDLKLPDKNSSPKTGTSIENKNTSIHQKYLYAQNYMLNILANKYSIKREQLDKIWSKVNQQSKKTSLDPFLLLAVIECESNFNIQAISRAGAVGLTQIIPKFHKNKLNSGESFYNMDVSIRVGSEILSEYIEQENGNVIKGLQKYNGNPRDQQKKYASKILQKKIELENLHYEGALKFQNETIDNSEHFISHVSDKYDNFSQKQSI